MLAGGVYFLFFSDYITPKLVCLYRRKNYMRRGVRSSRTKKQSKDKTCSAIFYLSVIPYENTLNTSLLKKEGSSIKKFRKNQENKNISHFTINISQYYLLCSIANISVLSLRIN